MQFLLAFWGLAIIDLVMVTMLALVLLASEAEERVSQILAIVAGFSVANISAFSGRTLPELMTQLLVGANPVAMPILLFGVFIPAMAGLVLSIVIVRQMGRQKHMAFRLIAFLGMLFVAFSVSTIGYVLDFKEAAAESRESIRGTDFVDERLEKIKLLFQRCQEGVGDSAYTTRSACGPLFAENVTRALEACSDLRGELTAESQSVDSRAIRALMPSWTFLCGAFLYLTFFFQWPKTSKIAPPSDLGSGKERDS